MQETQTSSVKQIRDDVLDPQRASVSVPLLWASQYPPIWELVTTECHHSAWSAWHRAWPRIHTVTLILSHLCSWCYLRWPQLFSGAEGISTFHSRPQILSQLATSPFLHSPEQERWREEPWRTGTTQGAMGSGSSGSAQPPGSPGLSRRGRGQPGIADEAWDDNWHLSATGRPTQVPGKSGWVGLPSACVPRATGPQLSTCQGSKGSRQHGSNLNMEIIF